MMVVEIMIDMVVDIGPEIQIEGGEEVTSKYANLTIVTLLFKPCFANIL